MTRWGYIPVRYGSSQNTIPDIHIRGVDPAGVTPNNPGTGDYRTPEEVNAKIARGIRYLYDPALALPYKGATAGTPLRYIPRTMPDGSKINQTLPPMPRLPVCPGLLYFGAPDRSIGS